MGNRGDVVLKFGAVYDDVVKAQEDMSGGLKGLSGRSKNLDVDFKAFGYSGTKALGAVGAGVTAGIARV